MSTHHPNNIVEPLRSLGYDLADLLPAFPGRDTVHVDAVLRDNALATRRPVLPYGLLGVFPCESDHFNVAPAGFRRPSRDVDLPWPPSADRTIIYCLGGSTMFGYNVADAETIPALLRKLAIEAGLDWEIYNFASGNYTSRHSVMRLLAMIDDGHVPDHVIFLDGFNECFYTYPNRDLVTALNGLYQAEKRRRKMGALGAIADYAADLLWRNSVTMPTSQTLNLQGMPPETAALITGESIIDYLAHSDTPWPDAAITQPVIRAGQKVWNHYLDSVALTTALAERRGFGSTFVWQPVPLFATPPNTRLIEKLILLFPTAGFTAPVYNWLAHAGFPGMAGDPRFLDASRLGKGQSGIVQYVDLCHYTADFGMIIASTIFAQLRHQGVSKGKHQP